MRDRVRIPRPLLALLVSLAIVLAGHPVAAFCPADGPAGMLECITAAYAQRDIEAYGQLLALDYVSVSIGPLQQADVDRSEDIEVTRRMFTSPSVEAIVLSFGPTCDVAPGEEPATWRLDNLQATLSVRATPADGVTPKDYSLTQRMSLYVRFVPTPMPHYEVFREEHYQPE